MSSSSHEREPAPARSYFDLHDQLDALDKAGLLLRVDIPINKDTEIHPLMRWQFRGGVDDNDRKAMLFTNVIDAKGRTYDIPVVIGAMEEAAGFMKSASAIRSTSSARHGRARWAISLRRASSIARPASRSCSRARRSIGRAPRSTACRSRSRPRAGTTAPISRPRPSSPGIPTPGCRTSATIAPRSRRRGVWA